MEVMAIEAAQQVVTTVLCAIATAALGYVTATLKKQRAEDKAVGQIIKAMARKMIVDAYQAYVVEGKKMTIERFDELTETFTAYRSLGGNGTAERMYEEVAAKRPWIVTD